MKRITRKRQHELLRRMELLLKMSGYTFHRYKGDDGYFFQAKCDGEDLRDSSIMLWSYNKAGMIETLVVDYIRTNHPDTFQILYPEACQIWWGGDK